MHDNADTPRCAEVSACAETFVDLMSRVSNEDLRVAVPYETQLGIVAHLLRLPYLNEYTSVQWAWGKGVALKAIEAETNRLKEEHGDIHGSSYDLGIKSACECIEDLIRKLYSQPNDAAVPEVPA